MIRCSGLLFWATLQFIRSFIRVFDVCRTAVISLRNALPCFTTYVHVRSAGEFVVHVDVKQFHASKMMMLITMMSRPTMSPAGKM